MIPRYDTAEMRRLWSEENKFKTWLEVEMAAAKVMAEEGVVPAEEYEAMVKRLPLPMDSDRISALEKESRHDVIAFLMHVEELAGPPARILHYGMTSYDVVDTAYALRLRAASDLILKELDELLEAIKRRAMECKYTPCVGRSHGIHAEPVSFGVVLARWHAAVSRSKERIVSAKEEISYGKLSGAVGVYGVLPPSIEEKTMAALSLKPETAASQVVPRDRHAVYFNALAMLGTVVEDISINLRHYQRTEVGEVIEAFAKGQRGSSAMPHKKNPISAENLSGLSRLLRSYALAGMENVALWHERDISHSSVERMISPDASTLAHYIVRRLKNLIEGMEVKSERMLANLNMTKGLIFSEKVMLALVSKGFVRSDAYKIVQRAAMATMESGLDFKTNLLADEELKKTLTSGELEECFDMNKHLKHVDEIFRRVFGA